VDGGFQLSGFYPISPPVLITNTSFSAQAGVMDEMWACRVIRGKKVLVEKTMSELSLDNYVGVIYGHIRVEGLSRHAVAMCAGRLMQFSRQYQTAGIAPDYEIPDLYYDNGEEYVETTPTQEGESTQSLETRELPHAPVGSLPTITPQVGKNAWRTVAESHGVMICEMAIYGSTLPEGHLSLMFDRVADDLVYLWAIPEDPLILPVRFGELIYSCSGDSQLPKTGTLNVSVETQGCEILKLAKKIDPDGNRIPAGYPCAFHEILAEKIARVTGLKIGVNTSSTGCIVTMSIE
jgi:hypothetical protein